MRRANMCAPAALAIAPFTTICEVSQKKEITASR
jgi:hypothetical protein